MNSVLNAAIPGSDSARRLLRVIDAGLESDDEATRHGSAAPHCGVLGAFRYALGEPNGDTPTPWTLSPTMMYVLDGLNNCCWSSPDTRASGLRRLAIASLGTATKFDEAEFVQRALQLAIQTSLPTALRATAAAVNVMPNNNAQQLLDISNACEHHPTRENLESALRATADASTQCLGRRSADLAAIFDMSITQKAASAADYAVTATSLATTGDYLDALAAMTTITEAVEWARAAVEHAAGNKCRSGPAGDAVLAAYAEGLVAILIDLKTPGATTWLDLTKS